MSRYIRTSTDSSKLSTRPSHNPSGTGAHEFARNQAFDPLAGRKPPAARASTGGVFLRQRGNADLQVDEPFRPQAGHRGRADVVIGPEVIVQATPGEAFVKSSKHRCAAATCRSCRNAGIALVMAGTVPVHSPRAQDLKRACAGTGSRETYWGGSIPRGQSSASSSPS